MLHPCHLLYQRAIFLKGRHIEAHRFLVKFTLIFNKPSSIQQRLKRRSKRFIVVVGFMVLAFAAKEELGARFWMHRRFFVYDS